MKSNDATVEVNVEQLLRLLEFKLNKESKKVGLKVNGTIGASISNSDLGGYAVEINNSQDIYLSALVNVSQMSLNRVQNAEIINLNISKRTDHLSPVEIQTLIQALKTPKTTQSYLYDFFKDVMRELLVKTSAELILIGLKNTPGFIRFHYERQDR